MKFESFQVGDRLVYSGPRLEILNGSSDLVDRFIVKGDVGICVDCGDNYTISVRFLKDATVKGNVDTSNRYMRSITAIVYKKHCRFAPMDFYPQNHKNNVMYIGCSNHMLKGHISYVTNSSPEHSTALFYGSPIYTTDLLCIQIDYERLAGQNLADRCSDSIKLNKSLNSPYIGFIEGIKPLIKFELFDSNENIEIKDIQTRPNIAKEVDTQEIDPDMPELEEIPDSKATPNDLVDWVNKKRQKLSDDLAVIEKFFKVFNHGNLADITKEMADEFRKTVNSNEEYPKLLGISNMNPAKQFCLGCILVGDSTETYKELFDSRIRSLILCRMKNPREAADRYLMSDLLGLNRKALSVFYGYDEKYYTNLTLDSINDRDNAYVKYCLLRLGKLPKMATVTLEVDYEVAEDFYNNICSTFKLENVRSI